MLSVVLHTAIKHVSPRKHGLVHGTSHLDHLYFILDHLHVGGGAVARRHNLLPGNFRPDHCQKKTNKGLGLEYRF